MMQKVVRSTFNVFILSILILFILFALFAPLLASGKPLYVFYKGELYFPLFRYLLYPGYYTKPLDRFYNLMLLFFPFVLIALCLFSRRKMGILVFSLALLFALFGYFEWSPMGNPAWSPTGQQSNLSQINELVYYRVIREQQERIVHYLPQYHAILEKWRAKQVPMDPKILPTLWNQREERISNEMARLQAQGTPEALGQMELIRTHERWLEEGQEDLKFLAMPLIRPFHWEEEKGGNQILNEVVPWYELSRINLKDLTAALIFGARISLVVGLVTVSIALCIGIPFGALAGFYAGKFDIFVSRFLEVWEALPVLFMLLMIIAITGIKSVFWIILAIGIFGWTGFARYVRAETYRVKGLAFVEASRSIGYGNMHILFSHILPNSLTAVLVLIPFAILGAISAEAALSFLGLGEEGSCSLGVLMDEGRTNFPAQSYLLWPPAIVLSVLLITIALLNDAVRDALDPRLE